MKKTRFDWVIEDSDMWIVVKLNGGVNCMLQKFHPGFAYEKQQVLQDIEFSKQTAKATVKGLELLQA